MRTEKAKDGKAPVYAAIKVNGDKATLALKQSVTTRCWDIRKGMGKTTTTEGKELNIYLEEVRQVLSECYRSCNYGAAWSARIPSKAHFLKTMMMRHTLEEIVG